MKDDIKIGDVVVVEAQGTRAMGTVTSCWWCNEHYSHTHKGGGWIIEADSRGPGQRYFLWKQMWDGGRVEKVG
jgi:hypothetical protein